MVILIKLGYKWLWVIAVFIILSTSVYADCSSVWNNPNELATSIHYPVMLAEILYTNSPIRLKTVTMSPYLATGYYPNYAFIMRVNDSSILSNVSIDVNNVAIFNIDLDAYTDYRIVSSAAEPDNCWYGYAKMTSFTYPVSDDNMLFNITKAQYADNCSLDTWYDDTDNFYNILSIVVENITNTSCSECTYDCVYNMTNVSIRYCYDNNTLIDQHTIIFNGIENSFYNPEHCLTGCDNVTMTCNPPEYQQNIIIFGVIFIVIIMCIIVFKRRRR